MNDGQPALHIFAVGNDADTKRLHTMMPEGRTFDRFCSYDPPHIIRRMQNVDFPVLLVADPDVLEQLPGMVELFREQDIPVYLIGFISEGCAMCGDDLVMAGADDYVEADDKRRLHAALIRAERTLMWRDEKSREVGALYLAMDKLVHKVQKRTMNLVAVNDELVQDVSERRMVEEILQKLSHEHEQLIKSIPSILIGVNMNHIITHWNRSAEAVFGMRAGAVLGKPFCELDITWNLTVIVDAIERCCTEETNQYLKEIFFISAQGEDRFLNFTVSPLTDGTGPAQGAILMGQDITEQMIVRNELAQSRNLESIGALAAGIAHEINTPAQFVSDNIRFMEDSFKTLDVLLDYYKHLETDAVNAGFDLELIEMLQQARIDGDYGFIMNELPNALQQCLHGIGRISSIVMAMKDFTLPESGSPVLMDVAQIIHNMLIVSRSEWETVAEVQTYVDEGLPKLYGFPVSLNQAVLNILMNASDAVRAVFEKTGDRGRIEVTLHMWQEMLEIRVKDSGRGIHPDIKERILDPFFTTKEVGQGMGQGLPMAYNAIVLKHKGTLTVDSKYGSGATFVIRLPLEMKR